MIDLISQLLLNKPPAEVEQVKVDGQTELEKEIARKIKERLDLWSDKATEIQLMPMEKREKVEEFFIRMKRNKWIQFQWQQQWFDLTRENFKDFKWVL